MEIDEDAERKLQARWAEQAKAMDERNQRLAKEIAIAREVLGYCGRLLSGSKRTYQERYPSHRMVFNGNVCIETGKLWFGDLDLTTDRKKLGHLATRLGQKIFILREMDGRFDHELQPTFSQAVAVIEPQQEA